MAVHKIWMGIIIIGIKGLEIYILEPKGPNVEVC